MSVNDVVQEIARYRLHLSFFLLPALVIEWQFDDGGRPHSLWSVVDLEHALGVGLVALGLLLRSWAAGVIDKRSTLATAGPYVFVRHPLYLGSFLVALGLAEIMEDRLALVAVVLFTLVVYIPTIRYEERFLAQRFGGDWQEYAATTPSFLPRFSMLPATGGWQGPRWRRNREWRIAARVIAVIALLEWWNAVARGG